MPVAAKWLIVVLIVVLPVGLIASGLFDQQAQVGYTPNTRDVIYFAKEIVKKRLREPESAVFPADDQIRVETLADNRWRVAGYVDAQTGIKTRARYPWTIEMEKQGSRWKVIEREPELNELTKQMRENSWTKGLPGTK